jgi:hypothetical protein
MTLAFQTDTTRLITFMVAHDGSNRSYPFIGVPEGHHDTSHHGGDPLKKVKIAKINRFHATQLAHFIERLRANREADGTLLDSCLVCYGSGISDGDRHWHRDLPVLVAGRGGGAVRPGRHLVYPAYTPMASLYVSMLQTAGVRAERFADSRGPLAGLAG